MKKKDRHIDYVIAVQDAWKEGKQIEQSLKGKDEWKDKYTPFDWAVYDYRVKEGDEPKELTIEERARYYQANLEERNLNAEAWDFESAYRQGATEQRTCDIKRFRQIIHTVVIEELGMSGELARKISSHITKAMEE